MDTVPMSRFEKLLDGLSILRKYQPAAQMACRGAFLLVGDSADGHLPDGLKRKLSGLGFKVESGTGMFAFEIGTLVEQAAASKGVRAGRGGSS